MYMACWVCSGLTYHPSLFPLFSILPFCLPPFLSTVSKCVWALACGPQYDAAIEELCLAKFRIDMEELDQSHWCNWEDTVEWVGQTHIQTHTLYHKGMQLLIKEVKFTRKGCIIKKKKKKAMLQPLQFFMFWSCSNSWLDTGWENWKKGWVGRSGRGEGRCQADSLHREQKLYDFSMSRSFMYA